MYLNKRVHIKINSIQLDKSEIFDVIFVIRQIIGYTINQTNHTTCVNAYPVTAAGGTSSEPAPDALI